MEGDDERLISRAYTEKVAQIALHKAVLTCKDRAERVAELLIPVDDAKQAGISADELLGYISANLTAAIVEPAVNDVKAIICFLYDECAHLPQQCEDGAYLEQGEIRTEDACCQTDDAGCYDSAEIPRLSVEEEANMFLSDLLSCELLNVSTPVQPTKPAGITKAKKSTVSVSNHQSRLKRRLRKVKSTALQAELMEFARDHHKILYAALDQHNVSWVNCHFDMNHMVLREALLLYQHRMSHGNVKYPKKMLRCCLNKVKSRVFGTMQQLQNAALIRAAQCAATNESPDPHTAVGCWLISASGSDVLSAGYNTFPKNIDNTPKRWERPLKYDYVVHAECNAIAAAARKGICIDNCRAVITLFPCLCCCKLLIQSGMSCIIVPYPDWNNMKWKDDFKLSRALLDEANITIHFVHQALI